MDQSWSAQIAGVPVQPDAVKAALDEQRDSALVHYKDKKLRAAAVEQYDAAAAAAASLSLVVGLPDDLVTVGISGAVNLNRRPGDGPGEVVTIKVVAPDPATIT